MNFLHWRRGKSTQWVSLIGIVLLYLLLIQGKTFAQSVSEWAIPGTPNIQGLDALIPENPYRLVYFTEYAPVGRIGMLNNISGGNAFLSEWLPVGAPNGFSPFKIVAGLWNFYTRTNPSFVTADPFLNPPLPIKTADVLKYIQIGFRLTPIATFTLPDEDEVGMLVPSPFGGPDIFYLWNLTPTAASTGLAHPWDIQRRSVGADEVSAWISNREPQQALYQFFPLSSSFLRWDLSKCGVTPIVYYVVPTSKVKGPTEIWIGGTHTVAGTTAPNLTSDCIVYMRVDPKNVGASVVIWDLPPTPVLRSMNAILVTHVPNIKTGFNNMEVWLSSSTSPEMTILKPHGIFSATAALLPDSVCFTTGQEYSSPNGLFWDDPSYFTGLVTANDNARRIWVTSAGVAGSTTGGTSFLSANKGGVDTTITFTTCQTTPTPFEAPLSRILAERVQQQLFDSSAVTSRQDSIPCSIDRFIWDPTTGFGADYSGALLDIDMQGQASPSPAGSSGFLYSIIWHEPQKGRIGMLWSMTAPLPRTIFDVYAPESIPEEAASPFKLEQNFPNPFNPSTTISYNLPSDSRVTLKVYNTLGQQVATLVDNETQLAGEQTVNFNAVSLPSGVYFYQIQAQDLSGKGETRMLDAKKMILVK